MIAIRMYIAHGNVQWQYTHCQLCNRRHAQATVRTAQESHASGYIQQRNSAGLRAACVRADHTHRERCECGEKNTCLNNNIELFSIQTLYFSLRMRCRLVFEKKHGVRCIERGTGCEDGGGIHMELANGSANVASIKVPLTRHGVELQRSSLH